MSFYLFRRYFFASRAGALVRLVSWICLGGMAVSLSALILIVSVMGGFGQAIKSRLLDNEAHLALHLESNPFLSGLSGGAQPKSLFLDKEKHPLIFASLPEEMKKGVKEALLFETQELILKIGENFIGASAKGYSKKQWRAKIKEISPWPAAAASAKLFLAPAADGAPTAEKSPPSPLKAPALLNDEKELILSYDLALEAGLSPGDSLTLIPLAGLLLPPGLLPPVKKRRVKGILPPKSSEARDFSIYHKQGLMDFGAFSKINYRAELKLYDPERAESYQKFFSQYKPKNWMERNSSLFFALKLEKFIMTLFLALAFLISCLGVSSALFLLISQKGEDLAILHAMGLSQKKLVKTFSGAGLSLAFIGLLAGAFIGLAGTAFLKYNSWNILPEMYQDRTIPAQFAPFHYGLILLGAWLLSWVSCYWPARQLSRMKPAELLKSAGF